MKNTVTVRYRSGREERFEVELRGGNRAQDRLKDFAESPNVLLNTGEEVIIIPSSAIECISIKLIKGDTRFNFNEVMKGTRAK